LYLPAPASDFDAMFRALGRLLCNLLFRKFVDETKQNLVFCSHFSPFLFMYLCHEEDKLFADDADAAVALDALATFEPKIAKQWRTLLDADSSVLDDLMITADLFDERLEDSPVTCENVATLVKAGCQHRLIAKRQRSLQLVRDAFYHVDHAGKLSQAFRSAVNKVGGAALTDLLCTDLATPVLVLEALKADQATGWTPECEKAYSTLRQIIGKMKPEEIKLFLKFVVGSSSIVPGDSVRVTVDASHEGRMPSSHTCDKHFEWPVDATMELLFMAMNEVDAAGFQIA